MNDEAVQQDFEFVLFASAVIDYDYIIGLMAASTHNAGGKGKKHITCEEIIAMLRADAKFQDEATIWRRTLAPCQPIGLSEDEIREDYGQ